LLVFYLSLTAVSERFFGWLTLKVTKGHSEESATSGIEVAA